MHGFVRAKRPYYCFYPTWPPYCSNFFSSNKRTKRVSGGCWLPGLLRWCIRSKRHAQSPIIRPRRYSLRQNCLYHFVDMSRWTAQDVQQPPCNRSGGKDWILCSPAEGVGFDERSRYVPRRCHCFSKCPGLGKGKMRWFHRGRQWKKEQWPTWSIDYWCIRTQPGLYLSLNDDSNNTQAHIQESRKPIDGLELDFKLPVKSVSTYSKRYNASRSNDSWEREWTHWRVLPKQSTPSTKKTSLPKHDGDLFCCFIGILALLRTLLTACAKMQQAVCKNHKR